MSDIIPKGLCLKAKHIQEGDSIKRIPRILAIKPSKEARFVAEKEAQVYPLLLAKFLLDLLCYFQKKIQTPFLVLSRPPKISSRLWLWQNPCWLSWVSLDHSSFIWSNTTSKPGKGS
jgi:hypothetical protein